MADEREDGVIKRVGKSAARGVAEGLSSKSLSSALMQGAFEKFGQAFTDTGFRGRRGEGGPAAGLDPNAMAPWRQAGAKAAERLEQRWQTMEYEDFQESHIEGFKAAAQTLQSEYQRGHSMLDDGLWVNAVTGEPEPLDTTSLAGQERIERYRGELHTKFFTQISDLTQTLAQEGVKYKGNTMIQETLMNMFENQSQQLDKVANPKPAIQGGQGFADISATKSAARTAAINAQAASKAAKQAARPISVKEALADENIGVANILPWAEDTMMNSPQAGAYIEQGKEVLTSQLHAKFKAEWVAGGGKEKEYDLLDPENIARVESTIAQSGGAIQRAATVEFVRAKDPAAAEEARRHSPQYFELMGDDTSPDAPKGIIDNKRISEDQRDDNVKAWKKPLAAKLEAYMSDPNNDPDIEVAINHIVDEWLPGAITGTTLSTAPSSIKATQSEGTKKYRELVVKFARRYLEQNFYKISKVAGDQNKEAKRIALRRISTPNYKKGLGRAHKALFGDE